MKLLFVIGELEYGRDWVATDVLEEELCVMGVAWGNGSWERCYAHFCHMHKHLDKA